LNINPSDIETTEAQREDETSEDSYIIETDLIFYHDGGGGGDDDALKFTSGKTNQICIKPVALDICPVSIFRVARADFGTS
jgi:hypothetical protein